LSFLTALGQLTVLAVFALAGVHKARGRRSLAAFGDAVAGLSPLRGRAARGIAATVVGAELGTAGLLAVGFVAGWAAVAGLLLAGVLLTSFTVVLVGAVRRGERVPCRCFGASYSSSSSSSDTVVGRRHVARNLGLLGCAATALVGHLAGHAGPDLATTVAAAAGAVAITAVLLALDDVAALVGAGATPGDGRDRWA
jgi:hypothetical protein